MDDLFPKIKKSISSLIEDEEGNIPGNKLLFLGTMVIILGSILSIDAFGAHRSHSSHRSHRSHSSGKSAGGHSSHVSHASHVSGSGHSNHANHASHQSHTSHSNASAHSNSRYSAEGDVTYAPAASGIQGVQVPAVSATRDLFRLPNVNRTMEAPRGTPYTGPLPETAVPAATPEIRLDAGTVQTPPPTKQIK